MTCRSGFRCDCARRTGNRTQSLPTSRSIRTIAVVWTGLIGSNWTSEFFARDYAVRTGKHHVTALIGALEVRRRPDGNDRVGIEDLIELKPPVGAVDIVLYAARFWEVLEAAQQVLLRVGHIRRRKQQTFLDFA